MPALWSRSELNPVKPGQLRTALTRVSAGLLLVILILVLATMASAQTNPKHFFWAPGQPSGRIRPPLPVI